MNSFLVAALTVCASGTPQENNRIYKAKELWIMPGDKRLPIKMEVGRSSFAAHQLGIKELGVRGEIYAAAMGTGLSRFLLRLIGDYLGAEPSYPQFWLFYGPPLCAGSRCPLSGFDVRFYEKTCRLQGVKLVVHAGGQRVPEGDYSTFILPKKAYGQEYVRFPVERPAECVDKEGMHFEKTTYFSFSETYAFIHLTYWPLGRPDLKRETFQRYELCRKETRRALFHQLFAEPKGAQAPLQVGQRQ